MAEKRPSPEELQRELEAARAELRKAEGEIELLRRQNEMIMNSLGEGIYWLDLQGNITYVNEAAARMFGYEQKELIGESHQMILEGRGPVAGAKAAKPDTPDEPQKKEVVVHNVNDDNFWRSDGTSFPVEYIRTSIHERGELVGTIITFRDITNRKELENTLQTLATTDGLTKLHNRLYFTAKLEEEFRRTERYKAPLSLMLLDIDNFKSINDTYGHQAGDAYLRALGSLVTDSIRLVDTAARYGGEEIAIVLPHTGSEAAVVMAERIRSVVEAFELVHAGKKVHTTISIGVATHMPGSARTTDEFLTETDNALYAAKRGGRNLVVLYKEGIDKESPAR